MRRAAALAFWLALAPLTAHAVEPDEVLSDKALEARARTISTGLRCLVCQNQSIDDSAAPLARDLRLLVRERLQQGDSDDAVRAFIVARYGQFVLLKPPFDTQTLLLWGTPIIVLALGGVGVALSLRRRSGAPGAVLLDADEQAQLDALVGRKSS